MKDHYAVLGVARDASFDEIKKAYRTLMLRHHSDREGGNHDIACAINEAYGILSDNHKRIVYDIQLKGLHVPGMFIDFTSLNVKFRFVQNPQQYNHYDYWNKLFASDGERFHISPRMDDGARVLMAHLTLFVLGEILRPLKQIEELGKRKARKYNDYVKLAEANRRKIEQVDQALFCSRREEKEIYDHHLGEPLEDSSQLALLAAMGGKEALATAIAIDPYVGFYSGFAVLHRHGLLTPALAMRLLKLTEKERQEMPVYTAFTPFAAFATFTDLASQGLLSQENIELIFNYTGGRRDFGCAIGLLAEANVLTQYYLELLFNLPNNVLMTAAMLASFLAVDLLNEDVFKAIKQQRISGNIWHSLHDMVEDETLTDPVREALKWQGPPALKTLNTHVHELLIHGAFLLDRRHKAKGRVVFQLALELKYDIKTFWEQPLAKRQAQFPVFRQIIAAKLHHHQLMLSLHRDAWFIIKANILTALTGIGLLLMGVNYALTGQFCLFKTASEYKANAVYQHLPDLCRSDIEVSI